MDELNDEVAQENQEETSEEQESTEETKDDATDWKAKAEELEGLQKRTYARLKKLEEKVGESEEPKAEATKKEDKKSSELDYGQKAFLTANGIKGIKEFEFVQDILEETGKELEDLLESKYFKTELENFRGDQRAKDAVPSSTKRATTSSRDTVEYWLAKGEYPPNDQIELRRKVLAAEMKRYEQRNKFTDRPFVGIQRK